MAAGNKRKNNGSVQGENMNTGLFSPITVATGGSLMDRIIAILEQARANVVRAVNSNMVLAYWLIGREIVQELQHGEERAEYGKQILNQLSKQLTDKYGRGFSTTNLRYFRTFYTVYDDRDPEIRHIASGELGPNEKRHTQGGVLDGMTQVVCLSI